jgi:1,4-alpha-glucan branching enzyme
LTEFDLHLFNEGSHYRLWEHLGAHPTTIDGVAGTYFAVWAPTAQSVSVKGDFNGWSRDLHSLYHRGASGIWEGFIPGLQAGEIYKYHIVAEGGRYAVDKADPLAFRAEVPPRTGSIVWGLDYAWGDQRWMVERAGRHAATAPISIYEVHLGSWRRKGEHGGEFLSYREMAPLLAAYVKEMGFTHVEFLPVMEHPFYGSWGYQTTGYFAPTSRYGTPQDFMYLVDVLHQNGIGVILDWVPSHFPSDEHGLAYFNGTQLFEHADPKKGFQPDWQSYIFNYGRHEVRAFLISSALFWLSVYHADALRVDAVASMLYLDYSRKEGEWIPNEFGGRENLEAIDFLRRLNTEVYRVHPDTQTIAEESTAWPAVSRPTYVGGLGFGLKWDMGWMHDTLSYFAKDPVHRKFHHGELSFRMLYAFHENFVLPLSHDEVVHGKGSLLGKMSGDPWQKFANLRLLYAYMFAQSAKKLLFMGGEFGQWDEWYHEKSLDWHLTEYDRHAQIQAVIRQLNALYRSERALHELDLDPRGFLWVDADDASQSCYSFLRRSSDDQWILVVLNATPVPRYGYRVGVPRAGAWREIFNSDAKEYGGAGIGNAGLRYTSFVPMHGHPQSLDLSLPPLGALYFKFTG